MGGTSEPRQGKRYSPEEQLERQLDLLQTRYAWLSDEELLTLPLARFYQLVRVSSDLKKEESYNELEKIAWASWQTNIPHWSKPLMFDKWKEVIGLSEVSTSPEDNMDPVDAVKHAYKIMQSDPKRAVKA